MGGVDPEFFGREPGKSDLKRAICFVISFIFPVNRKISNSRDGQGGQDEYRISKEAILGVDGRQQ
jgi:hypothetical protein